MDDNQANYQKKRKITALLAFLGAIQPTPVPLAGIHKFYLGQYGWGIAYIFLGATQVPRIACAFEGVWHLAGPTIKQGWSKLSTPPSLTGSNLNQTMETVANSLREIEHLRQEGLLSEHEFEQKRRSLLKQIP
ncbi:MAG: TM2 domain-containing protein [Leptolyngbyaceae cyanobacterium MAG.088]|nr:TM2 domain-containing protein [Leptolyngbyaceae cyanobacterium MAG.088]